MLSVSEHRLRALELPEEAGRDAILRRADNIEAQVDALRRALYPSTATIHLLPTEIIRYIFEEIHNNQDDNHGVDGTVALSAVCRLWRAVTLSMPSLWSNIRVALPWKSKTPKGHLALALERSKETPIDLVCRFTIWSAESQDESEQGLLTMQRLLNKIMPHHGRIRSLDISISTDRQRELLVKNFNKICVPRLERFCLTLHDLLRGLDDDEPEYTYGSLFNGGAPSLQSVELRGCGFLYCKTPLQSRITKLVIDNPDYYMDMIDNETFNTILEQAPSLSSLELVGERTPLALHPPADDQEVICTRIKHLCLDDETLVVTRCIAAPELESLHIKSVRGHDLHDFIQFLLEPISPRYPSLTTLNLDWATFTDIEQCQTLIHCTPSVKHLQTREEPSQRVTLLESVAQTPGAWPLLETLTTPGILKNTLLNFVCSRVQGEARTTFQTLLFKQGFLQTIRRDYPAVCSWIEGRGVEMIGQSVEPHYESRSDWSSYMRHWEDGSAESIFGTGSTSLPERH